MRWPSAPTRPGPTWRRRCGPRACRCSASTPTAPPRDFDVLAFNLSAELVYTNLLNLVDLAGVPVRNEHRAPADPIVIAGGHCAYNPEPLAEYVDAFVIGDGEEVVGEIAEVVGAWKRGGRASPRRRCCASSRRSPACTCRRCTTSSTTAQFIARGAPALRRRSRRRRQAHRRRPRRLAVPEAAARAARRGRARPAQRRDLPGLHPRVPLLPGRA